MPGESEQDPLAEIAESMRTAVGTQEAQLRAALGNEGYEKWKANQDTATELSVAQQSAQVLIAHASAESVKAHAGMAAAKAQVFRAVAGAVSLGALLAVALVVWVIVR